MAPAKRKGTDPLQSTPFKVVIPEITGPGATESRPTPPHSAELLIVRSPGGFAMFTFPDDLDAKNIDAVAGTPGELAEQVVAWARANRPLSDDYPA